MTRGGQDVTDNVTVVETVRDSVHNVTESNRTHFDLVKSPIQLVSSSVNDTFNQGNATSFPINKTLSTVSTTNATTHQAKSTKHTKFESGATWSTTVSYWDNYNVYNNLPSTNRLMRSRKSKFMKLDFSQKRL